ncbi:hypothetical protein F511_39197 [Dorcoceras hygrometricum]|uniref:Uncharacterized protein n=1 Tax=Dorcoceras hygrometricum TaxID=472368 RepID=A0A2Z7BCW4_9LAMI|nr:hypothetical protein F511_39197 [Dorcoceras hygrometricum]
MDIIIHNQMIRPWNRSQQLQRLFPKPNSERETPIDLEHLDKMDVGGEGNKKRSNWSKFEDEDVSIDLDADDEDTHPIGQQAAKRKGKRKFKSDIQGMTENFNTMREQFNEYKPLKKAEYDLKQKQLEVEEIKAKYALARSSN